MKRFATHVVLCFLIGHLSFSQEADSDNNLKNIFRFEGGFHGFGLGKEFKLSEFSTFDVAIGNGAGYRITSAEFNLTWNRIPYATYIKTTYKQFIRRAKWIEKEKDLSYNSGSYVGAMLKYSTFDTNSGRNTEGVNDAGLVNVHIGLIRPIIKRVLLTGYIGVGYAYDFDFKNGTIIPALNLKAHYVISQK